MDPIESGKRPGPEGAGRRESGGHRLSRQTLEGVRVRDPVCLGELFDGTIDRIYGLAYRLLGDPTAAEDATQEVFLRVHRAADRLDVERDPVPWLLKVTHNVCRDVWRSRGHRLAKMSMPLEGDTSLHDVLASDAPDPEQVVMTAEQEEQVQRAIMRLPESFRVVILLHDYEGLRHDEIAGVVGISHAAVRKRYSRALSRLGELLKEVPS